MYHNARGHSVKKVFNGQCFGAQGTVFRGHQAKKGNTVSSLNVQGWQLNAQPHVEPVAYIHGAGNRKSRETTSTPTTSGKSAEAHGLSRARVSVSTAHVREDGPSCLDMMGAGWVRHRSPWLPKPKHNTAMGRNKASTHASSPTFLVFPRTTASHSCDATFCTTKSAVPTKTVAGVVVLSHSCACTRERGLGSSRH